jgi:uncharacterized protein (DUF433 family)
MRLRDDQQERLERAARRLGRTPSATAALLLEQRLREQEFPGIAIKDTLRGPEAFVEGTRWPVWTVVARLRSLDGDVAELVRRYDGLTSEGVRAAARYAEAFASEIAEAIGENRRSPDDLKVDLPELSVFEARAPTP